MEKLRNWYIIHVKPVLPCIRLRKRDLIPLLVVTSAVLGIFNIIQLVWQVSLDIENEQVHETETVHIICRGLSEEQVRTLQKTKNLYNKRYDGAYSIEYIQSFKRRYDTQYDVGLRLIRYPGRFYKNDIIIGLASFRQQFSEYLLETPGASIEVTPLYYKDAHYRFSTFVYHLLSTLQMKSTDDLVTTVLDTEAHYIVKSPLGLDPACVSEVTVHFFRLFFMSCIGCLIPVAIVVYLETKHLVYCFGIFSVFGADSKRLRIYLYYKLLFVAVIIVLPSLLFTYLWGILLYGIRVLRIAPFFSIRSIVILLLLLLLPARVLLTRQCRQSVIRRIAGEDNTEFIHSPRSSIRRYDPSRFSWMYTIVNWSRFQRWILLTLAFSMGISVAARSMRNVFIKPESAPAFTLEFPETMEYEVYENRLYLEIASIAGIAMSASIQESADNSILRLYAGDQEIQRYRIVAANEALYEQMPFARRIIADGDIVLSGEANTLQKYALVDGMPLRLEIPIERTKDLPTGLSGKRLRREQGKAYSFTAFLCTIGAVAHTENTEEQGLVTLYVPYELYRKLYGSITGNVWEHHLALPENYTADPSVIRTESYKSMWYTEDFTLCCAETDANEAAWNGSYTDLMLGERTIAIRCSRTLWDNLGYAIGDTIRLSDAGRKNVWQKEGEATVSLRDKLYHLQYTYTNYRICAVQFDENAALEIHMGPYQYERATSYMLAYHEAAITYDDTIIEKDSLYRHLRILSGNYYKTYVQYNDTVWQDALLTLYRRTAVKHTLLMLMIAILCAIQYDFCTLFHARRAMEYRVLSVYASKTGWLRYGMYIPMIPILILSLFFIFR